MTVLVVAEHDNATLKVAEPPKRKGGGKVADAKELVAKLRNEAKVIP